MAAPKDITVSKWQGLDLSGPRIRKDMASLREARNMDLTDAGLLRSRDAFIIAGELHPQSVGLYKANGTLRAAVPSGSKAYKQYQPTNVVYDMVGDSATEDFPDRTFDPITGELTDGMKRVSDAIEYGIDEDNAGIPYIVVQLANGQFIHHYMDASIDEQVDQPVVTRVSLDFLPGPNIEKLKGKIFAIDRKDGVVQFCATGKPRDWTAPNDSGFLGANREASGERRLFGLAQHNGNIVVAFPDAIQIWAVFADPANNTLIQAINGPGTRAANTLKEVKNDIFYFSEGGFSSLRAQTIVGELRQEGEGAGNIGTPIFPLTKEEVNLDTAVALWSQARSQYLCAFTRPDGTSRVYAFKSNPALEIFGWTYWDLPFPVEYMVELNGELFMRGVNTLYRFDPQCDTDEIDKDTHEKVDWEYRTNSYATKSFRDLKQWETFDSIHKGKARFDFIFEDTVAAEDIEIGITLEGDSLYDGWIPIVEMSPSIGLRVSGKGAFTQEAFTFSYSVLNQGFR